jgi:hypothetical protein
MDQFCHNNPNATVTMEIVVHPESQGNSRLNKYYHVGVVPAFREAYKNSGEWLTDGETDKRLCIESPMAHIEVDGKIKGYKQFEDLSLKEGVEMIEHLKQWGAENFDIYIPEPKNYYEKDKIQWHDK